MENIEENQADMKPNVSSLKRKWNSMQCLNDCSPATSTSYCFDDQKPFTMPWHGDNTQNPFLGFLGPSDPNEILLRLDQCDANANEIPALFKYMEKYLPGYRFVPSDEQLLTHYLRKKIGNEPIPRCLIRDVDLYEHHPKELAEAYPRHDSQVNEWYFFSPRDRKYPNGTRPKRAAGNGYWKATGADKPVKVKDETIGFRQALVFYEGKPSRGVKTSWIMHEFKAVEKRERYSMVDMRLDDWVLCRIYYKKVDKPQKKKEEGPGSNSGEANEAEEMIHYEEDGPGSNSGEANEAEEMIHFDDDDFIIEKPNCIFPSDGIFFDTDYLWDNGSFDSLQDFDQAFGIPDNLNNLKQ